MFFVPPCMRFSGFMCNGYRYNTYRPNDNIIPYRLAEWAPGPEPPECQGLSEQLNSVKYYFLKYCQSNNSKCFICFKPLSTGIPSSIGEGLPPASGWHNILKIDGVPNSFTITIPVLLVPQTVSSDKILAVKIFTVPLKLYWSSERGDNFTTASAKGEADAIAARYKFVRIEGYIYPYKVPQTVPLKLYWNIERGDNFTTATAKGEADAIAAGYKFVREEGYIYPSYVAGTVPLKLYWSSERGDNFTTATAKGEADAIAAGYKFVRIEGYILPS